MRVEHQVGFSMDRSRRVGRRAPWCFRLESSRSPRGSSRLRVSRVELADLLEGARRSGPRHRRRHRAHRSRRHSARSISSAARSASVAVRSQSVAVFCGIFPSTSCRAFFPPLEPSLRGPGAVPPARRSRRRAALGVRPVGAGRRRTRRSAGAETFSATAVATNWLMLVPSALADLGDGRLERRGQAQRVGGELLLHGGSPPQGPPWGDSSATPEAGGAPVRSPGG